MVHVMLTLASRSRSVILVDEIENGIFTSIKWAYVEVLSHWHVMANFSLLLIAKSG